MWFWIKHLSFAVVLVALAGYFLLGDGPVLDFKLLEVDIVHAHEAQQ